MIIKIEEKQLSEKNTLSVYSMCRYRIEAFYELDEEKPYAIRIYPKVDTAPFIYYDPSATKKNRFKIHFSYTEKNLPVEKARDVIGFYNIAIMDAEELTDFFTHKHRTNGV